MGWCCVGAMLCSYGIPALIIAVAVTLIYADVDILTLWNLQFGKKPESLSGKVVWITGASSGIGEYLAYRLARAGCRLVLSARRKDLLEKVKQNCIEQGQLGQSDVMVLEMDALDFSSHSDKAKAVIDHFHKIDVLVNNAGRTQRAQVHETELAVDREMLELNVLGVLSVTKAVLPYMMDAKSGHLVVTSSIAGKIGVANSATYSATKFAVQGWFDAARVELTSSNIDVTMLCPGPVFSPLLKVAFTGKAGQEYNQEINPNEKRMTTERCADVMAVAIANRMFESWISRQPALLFTYIFQYFPNMAPRLASWMGQKTVSKIREAQH